MASRNSETDGFAIGLGLLAFAAIVLWIVIYILAGIVTAVFTVMSLMALWRPLKIGKQTITPKEARWFLVRGIIGVFAFPLIAAIAAQMLKIEIEPEWRVHLMAIGYMLGSLGGEWVSYTITEAQTKEEAAKKPPVPQAPTITPPKMIYQGKPFEYASWNDEEDPYK